MATDGEQRKRGPQAPFFSTTQPPHSIPADTETVQIAPAATLSAGVQVEARVSISSAPAFCSVTALMMIGPDVAFWNW